LPEIAETVLARMAEAKPITKIRIGINSDSNFTYKIN
jgi:hypothetical protein